MQTFGASLSFAFELNSGCCETAQNIELQMTKILADGRGSGDCWPAHLFALHFLAKTGTLPATANATVAVW